MFQRLANSWKLAKASMSVLRADKELMIFPIISSVGVLIVAATFALPMFLAGFFDSMAAGGKEVLGAVVALMFYLAQYFVIFFANSALVGTAMIRLRGGDPTVGDGFCIAFSHSRAILGYALISATVGMILRWLSEHGGILRQIVSSLVGLAWNIATFLVVPVLMEDIGPLDAIERSVELLKKTWGEQIVGDLSIGFVFGLMSLAVILVGVPLIVAAAMSESVVLIVLAILAVVLGLVFSGLVNSTLSGIYTAAVYQYATTGQTGGYFDSSLVESAFRQE